MKVYAVWFDRLCPWKIEKTTQILNPIDVIEFRDCDKFMTMDEIEQHQLKINGMLSFLKLIKT